MAKAQLNPRCHYLGKPYPVPLADSSERWLKVYLGCKAEAAYKHAKRTVDLAINYGIIEPEKITDRKADPLQLNLKCANVGFVHLFLDTEANRKRFPLVDFAMHPLVVEGFEIFNGLRNNDLGAQDRSVYGQLLEKPSLGTLMRLPDIMQYYGEQGAVSEKELARLDPSVFYFYKNGNGKSEYVKMAQVAHKVYGPLAEFFGYTKELAGDLDQMSYYHLNRGLYDVALNALRHIRASVKATNRIMNIIVPQLHNLLRFQGYDFDINVRDHKHIGRVMEKVDRRLKEFGGSVQKHVAELSDLAAFTVVLHSYQDKPIASDDPKPYATVANMVVDLTRGLQDLAVEFKDLISNPKANGYQSFHADMVFANPELVGMEAIIRNTSMEHLAREGGAAHYLYKGAGPEIQAIRRSYQNVKEAILKGLDA